MKTNVHQLTRGAILAALYIGLTLLQNLLLPGTASSVIQFRIAEVLCVFALFDHIAIPALTLGCLLANVLSGTALPLDFLVGTVATMLATLSMYGVRSLRVKGFPLPALLMPAVCNGILVGAELSIFVGGLPFWQVAAFVAAGEAAVMLVLGTVLFYALSTKGLSSKLFRK